MLLTSLWSVDLIILLTSFIFLIYKYFTRHFDYWKKQGVFYFKPIPFIGNFYDAFTWKLSIAEVIKCLYDKTNEPYFGVFLLDQPVLVIKSPEIIKHILIKDFTSFRDRTMADGAHNKVISNWIAFQKYPSWKKTRPKLAQMFSSGKLKTMFNSVIDVSTLFSDFLNQNVGELDAKEVCIKFTTENTAKCFFGIKGNCFKYENSELNIISKRIFEMSLRNGIIHGLYISKPSLVNLFRLNFIKESDMNFLLNAFKISFNSRKVQSTGNKRKIVDYIDMLIDMEDTEESSISDYESDYFMAMANSLVFYLGGVETTSSLLSFTLYEWALHPDIQEKARQEVFGILEKYGNYTFESLQEMKYLGLCMAETGRKYPTLQVLDRKAEIDYKVPDTDLLIKKGTKIFIPYYALHMDEKYFPEPEKYIPERFLDENINSKGIYYMPFGAGPRSCMGERFSQMIVKICLANILLKFNIETCDKTPKKIKFEPKSFLLTSDIGLPLTFKRFGN